MRRMFVFAALWVSCASMVLGGGPAKAADDVPAARLLPSEVLAYFTIPSVPEFKAEFNKSLLGQLANDPAMQPFLEQIQTKLSEGSTALEEQLGVNADDLWTLPQGQVTLALLGQARTMAIVALLEFGKNQQTLNVLLEKMEASAKEKGATRSTEDLKGTEAVVYTFPAPEAEDGPAANAKPRSVAYFIKDETIVFGSELPALQSVLERWDGKANRTLAHNDVYSYIAEQTTAKDSRPLLQWYLNPIGLLQSAIAQVQAANPQAQMVLGILPILGIDRVRGLGGSFEMNRDGLNSISRTFAYVDQPTSGLLNILKFPAVELAPPKWVSDQAVLFYAINWDIATAYRAIESMFDMFQGPGAFQRTLDTVSAQDNGPKIHLKKDLIDQLTGRLYIAAEPPNRDAPDVQRVLFALGVKDPARMKQTLAAAAEAENVNAKARQIQGITVYELPTRGEDAPQMAVTVAQDSVLIATDVSLVEQVLKGGAAKPLAQSPTYRAVAEYFPKQTSIIGYQKQDAQIRTAYESLRSGETPTDLEGIDFSKLPPFEVIEKYLRPSGTYAQPDERGVRFISFSLSKLPE